MLDKLITTGVNMALLPARTALRTSQQLLQLPQQLQTLRQDMEQQSAEILDELQAMAQQVDEEMQHKAADLNNQEKAQATGLALSAAEHHARMATVNVLRALWLSTDSEQQRIDKK